MKSVFRLARQLRSVHSSKLVRCLLLTGGAGVAVCALNQIEWPKFGASRVLFPLLAQCAAKYEPQGTVISDGKNHSLFLTIHLSDKAPVRDCLKVLGKIQHYVDTISPPDIRDENDEIQFGIGFGPEFMEKIRSNLKYAGATEPYTYKPRHGSLGDLPYTGGDIFIHAKCNELGKLFELAQSITRDMPKGSIQSFEDVYGWVYRNGRDLSGFMDGIENPADLDERSAVAINQVNGGSYAVTQKWIHRHDVLASTSESVKSQWLGRDLADDSELKCKASTSHVARMVGSIEQGAQKRYRIVRHSQPWGTLSGGSGLFFIGYAASPKAIDWMLDQMTGHGKDGENDDVMRFSRCVSGNYWYFPCLEELNRLIGEKATKSGWF
ncbi:unnamed protein product [Calicophoron daubneyi]|uniref:Dyp-type peroxidase C-terminal domain-containing protein n=1 Tax=Calicophoron daubneyi TaxID=300641 RepID=A0AAV2T506_CALDB